MNTVGAFEAKTHLSQLIDRVAKGERFTITRHGVPVAMLIPLAEEGPAREVGEIVEELARFRAAHPLEGISIRELIDEGRRF
ncbi:MAG: type II toxin-antitoxin system prevent-host-death family antitoxin [Phycisphaerae bacterium]|nr:type II toxin-antitoxin system prevent-host-death family antitoxin [Phycisphaerae bacterium]